MRFDVHHFHHYDEPSAGVTGKLAEILALLKAIKAQEIRMNAETQAALDRLNQAVTAETSVETSIETLLTGMAKAIADLKANQTDPAVIDAINQAAAIVEGNVAAAQAAVVSNTPAGAPPA